MSNEPRSSFSRSIYLGIIFLLAFSIPMAVLYSSGRGFARSGENVIVPGDDSEDEGSSLFPSSARVKSAGDFISIKSSPLFDASSGEDFLFFTWFWMKKFPEDDERIAFVAKLDSNHPSGRGYSFGINRQGGVVRPELYWRSESGVGQSWLFSEISLIPKQWFLLAFSLSKEKFLTVYSATVTPDGGRKIEFHGGHELKQSVFPKSVSDLILGAKGEGVFRGRLGPFGILRGAELGEEMSEIFADLANSPLEIPARVEESEVALFVSGVNKDLSSHAHEVRSRGLKKKVAPKGEAQKGEVQKGEESE